MKVTIVEKSAFMFVGVSRRVPLQFEGVNNAIVEWAKSITPKKKEEMHRLQNIELYEIVNVNKNQIANFWMKPGN